VTTVLRVDPGMSETDVPRPLRSRPSGSDLVFVMGTRAVAASVLAITGGIGIFLALRAVPTFQHYGISSPRCARGRALGRPAAAPLHRPFPGHQAPGAPDG
jgi:hypothetical protein